MRLLKAASWSISAGDGRYYGWRWWVHVGPAILLIGRGVMEDER